MNTPANHTGLNSLARCLFSLFIVVIAPIAHGEWFQTQANEAVRTVAETAPDANLIFVLDDAAKQRKSRAGRSMTELLTNIGLLDQDSALRQAWSGFSEKVGMPEDKAFDLFFGRRAIFISQDLTIAGGGEWALATVVPTKLAYQVLESLGAKRRDMDSGNTIFAIEDGAYRISLVRSREDTKNKSNSRIFVVAPRESRDLFRVLVRGLGKQQGWDNLVGRNERFQPQIAGVFRADGQDVGLVNVLQTEAGWHGIATLSTPHAEQQTVGWTGSQLEEISAGAWLAMFDEVDPVALLGTPIGNMLQLEPELVTKLDDHTTQRVALTVRPARNGVSVMAGIETDGTVESAEAADSVMKDVVEFFVGRPDASPDYQGFLPQATRTAKLDGLLAEEFLIALVGDEPNLSWLIQNKDSSNWWVLRLGPTTGNEGVALRTLADSLPEADQGGQIISTGVARPGPLASVVDGVAKSDRPLEKPLHEIETMQWSERYRPGKSEIRFEFRMYGSDD